MITLYSWGIFHIDILNNAKDHYNYLSNFCDTFSLNNLIKRKTCFKAEYGTFLDVMLTNRPRGFHKTSIIETGFSDHHNMILSFCQTHFERLKSKKLEDRNYKKFDKSKIPI